MVTDQDAGLLPRCKERRVFLFEQIVIFSEPLDKKKGFSTPGFLFKNSIKVGLLSWSLCWRAGIFNSTLTWGSSLAAFFTFSSRGGRRYFAISGWPPDSLGKRWSDALWETDLSEGREEEGRWRERAWCSG